MALNLPAAPTTATTISVSNFGTKTSDSLSWLATDAPHARVWRSTTQSLTSGAATAVLFDSERVDVGAMHSTSTNTSRLTVPSGGGGFYMIGGHVAIAASSAGTYRLLGILLNGATYIAFQTLGPLAAGTDVRGSITTGYQLAVADYVELVAQQDSGGALNVLASTNYSAEFWCKWVST